VKRPQSSRIIFVTATGTAVGKTLLTGLLLAQLRQSGIHALAMKPFCSGGTADVELLHALQERELTRDEINPFYFPEPLAPLISARKHHRLIKLQDVLKRIASLRQKLDLKSRIHPDGPRSTVHALPCLLIEGSGGLLVPLGEGYSVLDLIVRLRCEVIVVSSNRLGTINHTLLTIRALQAAGIEKLKVVLTNFFPPRRSAPDTPHNHNILSELLAPVPLFALPFLGPKPSRPHAVTKIAKRFKRQLVQIIKN